MLKKTLGFIIVLVLAVVLALPCVAQSTSWGLSFPEPGKTPRGNASAEALLEYDGYFVGSGKENVIYLTFDAGYENGYTERILDVLKATGTPAAFFLVGTYIRDNPDIISRMVGEGHIVGNHTTSHPDMSAISDMASFKKELNDTEDYYKNLTGQDMPKFYRPPRGVYSTENLKMAKELGYKTIFWSLAYVDWKADSQPTPNEAYSKLLPRVHPGAVLLLHSTSKTNAEILENLINEYKKMGYEFKSLSHLVA